MVRHRPTCGKFKKNSFSSLHRRENNSYKPCITIMKHSTLSQFSSTNSQSQENWMPPQLLNTHAPRIRPVVTHNQTNNVVATVHRCCIYISAPPSRFSDYTVVQPRSSDCAIHFDTVSVVPARIPEYYYVELAVWGWDLPVGRPLIAIQDRCSISCWSSLRWMCGTHS
jgi:hypothetical protein